jgi:mercuric ion binding protein
MKTLLIIVLLLITPFLVNKTFADENHTQSQVSSSQKTAIFSIEKMTCKMCPITIRKAMENVEGVVKATVDFETKKATVVYDPQAVNTEAIALASTNSGYPAKITEQ